MTTAEAARAALAELPAGTKVVFVGGSREGAEALATELGLPRWAGWGVAGEPGSGAGPADVVRGLVASGRATGVLLCPLGPGVAGDDGAADAAARAGLPLRVLPPPA